MTGLPTITLDGLRLHHVDEQSAIVHVLTELAAGRGGQVVTVNLMMMVTARRDAWFRGVVNACELATADGMPLIWASKLMGEPLPQRVAGSSMAWTLTQAAAAAQRSIYLLGSLPGANERAAEVYRATYPGVKIVGMRCPPVGFENNPAEMAAITADLTALRPDLVYVALGCPKQERLIERLRPLLPRSWWLGVGASINFVAGMNQRAPRWMQKTGLEWIHRLLQEPRRLARRYLFDCLPYALRLLWVSWRSRRRAGAGG